MTMWPLSQRGSAGGLHAYKVHISAKRRTPPDVETLHVHEGTRLDLRPHRRLRLMLGADDLIIASGETVEFSTWTPHWFGAVDGPVEAIMIFGPHGERVHLHA
jgi:hypothetical protein